MAKKEIKRSEIIKAVQQYGFDSIDEDYPDFGDYLFHILDSGEIVSSIGEAHITFCPSRDISKYQNLEEIRKTETMEDPSFREMIEELIQDINEYEFEFDGQIIEFEVVN